MDNPRFWSSLRRAELVGNDKFAPLRLRIVFPGLCNTNLSFATKLIGLGVSRVEDLTHLVTSVELMTLLGFSFPLFCLSLIL